MSDKKDHNDSSEILRYLKGELSGRERNAFEKKMQSDPFLRDAVEGFELIGYQGLEDDMKSLEIRIRRRLSRRRRITIYSAAAAIASLLIVTTLFVKLYDFSPEEKARRLSESEIAEEVTQPPDKRVSEPIEKQEKGPDDRIERSFESAEKESEVPEVSVPEDEMEEVAIEVLEKEADLEMTEMIDEAITEDAEGDFVAIDLQEEEPEEEIVYFEATEKKAEPEESAREKRRYSTQPAAAGRESIFQKVADRPEGDLMYIDGVVISMEDNLPIPGANIIIKGTTTGTVTDLDGNFQIPVVSDSDMTLVAHYIGMESQEIDVADMEHITLAMVPDEVSLSEVVVIGYGISEPDRSTAGAVSEVKITDAESDRSYVQPVPETGTREYKAYIEENLRFPQLDTITEKAIVILKITIGSSGKITLIEPVRSPGEPFTSEAIRVVRDGPGWKPATMNNEEIEDNVRLRIVFKR